jgi:hypothetical protein
MKNAVAYNILRTALSTRNFNSTYDWINYFNTPVLARKLPLHALEDQKLQRQLHRCCLKKVHENTIRARTVTYHGALPRQYEVAEVVPVASPILPSVRATQSACRLSLPPKAGVVFLLASSFLYGNCYLACGDLAFLDFLARGASSNAKIGARDSEQDDDEASSPLDSCSTR